MADISKVDGKSTGDITSVDTILAADIAKIDGINWPSGGGGGGIVVEGFNSQYFTPSSSTFSYSFTSPSTQTDSNTGIIVLSSGWSGIGSSFDVKHCEGSLCTPTSLTERARIVFSNDGAAIHGDARNWSTSTTQNIEITQNFGSPIVVTVIFVSGLNQTTPFREGNANGGTGDVSTTLTAATQIDDMMFHAAAYSDFRPFPADEPASYITTMDTVWREIDIDNTSWGPTRYYHARKEFTGGSTTVNAEDPEIPPDQDHASALASFQPA